MSCPNWARGDVILEGAGDVLVCEKLVAGMASSQKRSDDEDFKLRIDTRVGGEKWTTAFSIDAGRAEI